MMPVINFSIFQSTKYFIVKNYKLTREKKKKVKYLAQIPCSIPSLCISLASQQMLVCHCTVYFTSVSLVKVKYHTMPFVNLIIL